jgi:hypothetical protein
MLQTRPEGHRVGETNEVHYHAEVAFREIASGSKGERPPRLTCAVNVHVVQLRTGLSSLDWNMNI